MAKVQLTGNADAAEFCPCEPYLDILAAATYTLREGDHPVRLGELCLFSAEKILKPESGSSHVSLTQLYHRETSGVFDIRWRPWSDGSSSSPCLAQASADGTLRLHRLEDCSASSNLELHESANVDVSSSMCLYVDWAPTASEPQVAVSHSDGSLSVIDVGQSDPEVISSWNAHGFEAWVVSYDLWQSNIVYSGGDDSQFCCWDLRETQRPVFRDRVEHQMGVCSIQSSPLWEKILVTGSYDENVRLWDMRMTQKPLQTKFLGGGVWRLKWHHSDISLLLAACMHNGFAVLRLNAGGFEDLEWYGEHKSLAYGGSWYRGDWEQTWPTGRKPRGEVSAATSLMHGLAIAVDARAGNQEESEARALDKAIPSPSESSSKSEIGQGSTCLVATCSFYDRALHIWEPTTLAYDHTWDDSPSNLHSEGSASA